MNFKVQSQASVCLWCEDGRAFSIRGYSCSNSYHFVSRGLPRRSEFCYMQCMPGFTRASRYGSPGWLTFLSHSLGAGLSYSRVSSWPASGSFFICPLSSLFSLGKKVAHFPTTVLVTFKIYSSFTVSSPRVFGSCIHNHLSY